MEAPAGPLPPYALHFDIPVEERSQSRTRQQFYVPLPPIGEHEHTHRGGGGMPSPPRGHSPPAGWDARPQSQVMHGQSYNQVQVVGTAREVVPIEAFRTLDTRMQQQERQTEYLMEKAMRVQEELVSSLGGSQNSWAEERRNRELLQEHINSILMVCKGLRRDIELMDEQLRQRDANTYRLVAALRQLEQQQSQAIANVKNTFGEKDQQLGHLSRELEGTNAVTRRNEGQIAALSADVSDRFGSTESRISMLAARVDALSRDFEMSLAALERELKTQMDGMRQHVSATANRLEVALQQQRKQLEDRQDAIARELNNTIALNNEETKRALSLLVENITLQFEKQGDRMDRLEAELIATAANLQRVEASIFERVTEHIEPQIKGIDRDVEQIKFEVKETFKDVQESIENLERVEDGKMQLMKDDFQREMAQIRKMVVLI